MFLFISKRIGQTVPVVLLVSFFVFFIINVIPGDPTLTVLGEFATPEQREIARQQYGFDRPMFVQYVDWLTKTLSGDLGRSLHSNERVWAMLADRLPVSLELSALALTIALLIGIPCGILAALRRGTTVDTVIGDVLGDSPWRPLFLAWGSADSPVRHRFQLAAALRVRSFHGITRRKPETHDLARLDRRPARRTADHSPDTRKRLGRCCRMTTFEPPTPRACPGPRSSGSTSCVMR